jgi:anthranilate/para-aminobenzoate synthase component II
LRSTSWPTTHQDSYASPHVILAPGDRRGREYVTLPESVLGVGLGYKSIQLAVTCYVSEEAAVTMTGKRTNEATQQQVGMFSAVKVS